LSARGEKSAVLRDTLARLYPMLAESRARLRSLFNDQEAAVLVDALKDAMHDPYVSLSLSERVGRVMSLQQLEERHRVNDSQRLALLNKLAHLHIFDAFALVDAVERYWTTHARSGQRGKATVKELLR